MRKGEGDVPSSRRIIWECPDCGWVNRVDEWILLPAPLECECDEAFVVGPPEDE